MAHDLRGPLANLALLIERIVMLLASEPSDQASDLAKRASERVDSIMDMLNAFLGRVRCTGDPMGFIPLEIDIQEIVPIVAILNQPMAENRRIKLDLLTAPHSDVFGDKALLIHAIDNLVGNAIKYAPEGSTIACHTSTRGLNIVVAVTNESTRVSESDIQGAFRPFNTLSVSPPTENASWGLGLWIVRLIAERHGGYATVQMNEGPRTCSVRFEIALPHHC
jgi:signal transduction histidine kinase